MENKKSFVIRYTAVMCMLLGTFILGTGCRNEPAQPKEKIESIEFDKERVVIKINEETTVKVKAKSDAAKKNEKIAYTSVNDGVIEIREPTNDGFIVKGLRYGSTVITAKSQLVTSYFEVVVEGENITAQYITVAQPVIEMLEGERRSTQVSLYGGSILDNNDFVWRLENGKDNIGIDVTANIAVVSALQRGHQKIIVSHPKSEYESEILVFVRGVDEEIHYISCQSNVVLVPNDGQYHDFSVILVNGKPEDIINFEYEVTEGGGNIEIVANGNVCNVLGIKSGTSVIRITHPLAVVEFDVRIIVYDIDIPFIVLEQTFLLMNIGESVSIGATVEYARNGVLSNNEFSYEIIENNIVVKSDNSIVEVVQNNHHFYIRARRGGSARIVISNEQAEMSHEILIVVREEVIFRDDYYITTSQNVIMTQVGADAVQLDMQLVNGNSGDANGFEWTVDDGTLITVESGHGIVRGNRAAINSVFNAIAIITPKKSGTAKITLYHPKSEVTATVMVKVYPKGTFAEIPVLVGCEGLIKVKSGAPDNDPDKSPKTVQLHMVSGDILDVGNLDWSTEQPGIATVNPGAHGVVNILSAAGDGLTKMAVNGPRLQFPHESLVLAGTPEYVDNSSVIYVDSIYQRLLTEQVVRIEVKDSQGLYGDSNGFKVEVENKNVLYAVMIKNQLVLQGKEAGETKVIVAHEDSINTITLNVYVDQSNVSISHPYYISGPEIKGVVRGWMYDDTLPNLQSLKVTLVGAGESETSKLKWVIEDSNVATITPSGGICWIQGKISNRQTKIKVSHPKAQEEKVIILYVVENEGDLYNKVMLGLENENFLLTKNDEKLIALVTNASEAQKLGITWKIRGEQDGVLINDVLSLDPHYDSAMIRARGEGNAELIISHPDNILPLSIYISVVEALSGEKVIKGPAVIELVKNDSKIVSLNHVNLTPEEVSNIKWKIRDPDPEIASLQENGDSAYMLGLKKGVGYVDIDQYRVGYKHSATLVCANTIEELASMYVMGVESSYNTMVVGEEKKVKLTFGSNGFPETAKNNLVWTADDSGRVRVVGKGEQVSIIAEDVGEAVVTVTDANKPNAVSFNETLEIRFLVRASSVASYEFRGHEKVKGIVVGNTAAITMRMYDGAAEVTNGYSQLVYENTNDNVITINPVDNIINMTANAAGQSYITVKHKNNLISEPAKILVYTANTLEELEDYYPILIEKTNYLLQIGENATVKIETISDNDNKIDKNGRKKFENVSWGVENASVIENVDFNGKKEVTVRGKTEGQCVVTVSYNGNVVGKIFITVVSNEKVDMTKYILTENIIGLVKNAPYSTKIMSNLGSDVSTVLWDSTNRNIVQVNGTGENATLLGIATGEAYVTVSYGTWLKRHILVYVCDNEAQVKAYRAMNMENQYIRAGLNETMVLPLYYAPNKTGQPTLWVDKYDNKVVSFNALESGGRLEITTLNEGVAVLEAVNTGLSNPSGILRIYIEVSKQYNGAPKPPEVRYLTVGKTVYLMNPDEKDTPLDLSVNGKGMTDAELARVQWKIVSGSSYVSIFPNGKDCQVRVNQMGLEGVAELQAYFVDNIVNMKIIVSRTGLLGYPHIVGEDVIRLGLGAKATYEYDVAEILEYDKNLFNVSIKQGQGIIATPRFNGNVLEVEGIASGFAVLSVTCRPACEFEYVVNVIVTTTADGIVYLTTRDNFSQVKIGESKVVSVEMVGMNNTSDAGYEWIIPKEEQRAYIDFDSTGRQAQIRGREEGAGKTVEIVVKNTYIEPLFNLKMYVRVSNAESNTTYLTTTKNIVSLVNGQSAYLDADLVNGSPGAVNTISWTTSTPTLLTVEGTGPQAIVIANNDNEVGIGKINIIHHDAVNTGMQILVVVEKDMNSTGIYISTESTLLDLKPNDVKRVDVRLVGSSDPMDIYGFRWDAPLDLQESIVKSGSGKNQQVISLATNGQAQNFITAIREGEATVKVSHPKCPNYVLDIKVYVRLYSTIRFTQRSVVMEMGDNPKQIPVTAPSGVGIFYSASKYKDPVTQVQRTVVNVSGTNDMCYIEPVSTGVCIVYASNALGTMTDEIVVQVNPNNNRKISYIQTPEIIYNMTDWFSALNRAMIAGTTVGQKDNGGTFTKEDNKNIQWTVSTKDNSQNIISFGDGVTLRDTETAEAVSVFTKNKTGVAVIEATHPQMSGYIKNIYVNVVPHDANFQLNPIFLQMQVDEEKTIESNIANVVEKRYDLVKWTKTPNESDEDGITIVKVETLVEDGTTSVTNDTGRKATVKADKPGVYRVKASFNDNTPAEATVFVAEKKKFELIDDSFITLLPYKTRFIGLYVEPDGSKMEEPYADYSEFATIDYVGPIGPNGSSIPEYIERPNRYTGVKEKFYLRSQFNPAKLMTAGGYTPNYVLAVTGTEKEGYTQIRLVCNLIERMVTLNTNYSFAFNMEGFYVNYGSWSDTTVVRGRPGQWISVKYNLSPEKEIIEPSKADNGYHLAVGGPPLNIPYTDWNRVVANNISIDFVKQTVSFYLNSCGYTELEYLNESNEEIGIRLNIPVYVYYDRINLNWKYLQWLYSHGKAYKSRLDSAGNAVYIADNEQLVLDLNDSLATNYPGNDLRISKIKFDYGTKTEETSTDNETGQGIGAIRIPSDISYTEGVFFEFNNRNRHIGVFGDTRQPPISSIVGSDSLLSVKFVGLLTVYYTYSTGGRTPSEFSKNFMIYKETWSRK